MGLIIARSCEENDKIVTGYQPGSSSLSNYNLNIMVSLHLIEWKSEEPRHRCSFAMLSLNPVNISFMVA